MRGPDGAPSSTWPAPAPTACSPRSRSSRVDRRLLLVGWDGEQTWLGAEHGTAAAWAGGSTVVVEQRDADRSLPDASIVELRGRASGGRRRSPRAPSRWTGTEAIEFHDLADGGSSAALLLPLGHDAARDGPLPVLLDPYGGPGWAKAVRDRRSFADSRRLAEHGYAVLVIDGVGAPGRSPAWERRIAGDLAVTLESQVRGLEEMAARRPGVLDLGAVGIRGWSFGGYLAALAAIRRPDVFKAAAVGAPVSDWTLYDTHYTERYLGAGAEFAAAAARSSLPGAIAEAVERGARPSPDAHPARLRGRQRRRGARRPVVRGAERPRRSRTRASCSARSPTSPAAPSSPSSCASSWSSWTPICGRHARRPARGGSGPGQLAARRPVARRCPPRARPAPRARLRQRELRRREVARAASRTRRRAAEHDVDPRLGEHRGERDGVGGRAELAPPRGRAPGRRRAASGGRWPAPP